uniref:snRNA-activating protein complex subunit 3 n=1 Tax=Ciona savignyi TaxID=51511 RepID=H2YME4_CIOSA
EVILNVSVSFPRDARRFKKCNVQFLVLGSQKLTELRDKIPCVLDEQPVGNFTENIDHPKDITLKDICPSSFFFIENTFFNDFRSPTHLNLAHIVRDWAKNNETKIPENTQIAKMEDCTFNDLKIRLGCPYRFLHQGDCEHLIIFTDIRIFNTSDCRSRSAYPVAISRANFKTTSCKVCSYFSAKYLTRFDSLTEDDPSFFCEACFKLLHFDKHGNKLGDFIAYPY